jgi:cysteine synthase A
MIPPQWDESLCDGTIAVSDQEATETTRWLARREGILAGYSTGANVAAALRLLREGRAASVATIAPDTGTRYLSTNLFAVEK